MTAFSDYVTSVGFRLELTHAQLRLFSAIALRSETRLTFTAGGSTTEANLIRKGLLERVDGGREIVLTKEGQLLVPLLRRANLLSADVIRTRSLATPEELSEELRS